MATETIVDTTTKDGVRIKVFHTPKPRENPLMEVASEAARGGMVGNEEVERTLERTREAIAEVDKVQLGTHGQLLASDLEEIISSGERWLREKNPNQILQQVFMESLKLGPARGERGREEGQVSKELNELYDALRRLTYVLVRSGDFRVVVREILGILKTAITETQKSLKEEAEGEEEIQKSEEDIVNRTVHILSVIGNKPEYHTAVEDFLLIVSELKARWESAQHYDVHRRWALDRAADFLAGFAGYSELDAFRKTLWSLWDDVTHDETFMGWLSQLQSIVDSGLKDPERMDSKEKKEELKSLLDRGRELVGKDIYKSKVERLIKRGSSIVQHIQEDPATLDLREKLMRFWKDFAFDAQGNPDVWVMDNSSREFKKILFPVLKKNLEDLQIDKVEMETSSWEGRLEDIIFSGTNLLPHDIDLTLKSKTRISLGEESKLQSSLTFQINILHLQPNFKNLKFYYRRKVFPFLEDHGVLDLTFPGSGISLFLKFAMILDTTQPPVIQLREVMCRVGELDVRIHEDETKHHMIDKFAVSVWGSTIKQKMAKGIATAVANSLKKFEANVNEFAASRPLDSLKDTLNIRLKEAYGGREAAKQAAKEAKYRAKASPAKVPSITTIESQVEQPVTAV